MKTRGACVLIQWIVDMGTDKDVVRTVVMRVVEAELLERLVAGDLGHKPEPRRDSKRARGHQ